MIVYLAGVETNHSEALEQASYPHVLASFVVRERINAILTRDVKNTKDRAQQGKMLFSNRQTKKG